MFDQLPTYYTDFEKENTMKTVGVEVIARIAHETNRAYCQSIGDNSQPAWEEAPDWQKSSAINGVNFHLDTLKAGGEPKPHESHESWLKQKAAEGWSFGPVKDAEKKEHPCFVPYAELPVSQQQKDYLFAAIVKAFYKCQLGPAFKPYSGIVGLGSNIPAAS